MSFSNELIGIPDSYWDADIDWVVVGEPAEYMQPVDIGIPDSYWDTDFDWVVAGEPAEYIQPVVVSELVEENESGQSFILALSAEEIDQPSVNSDPDSLLKDFYIKGTWKYYS